MPVWRGGRESWVRLNLRRVTRTRETHKGRYNKGRHTDTHTSTAYRWRTWALLQESSTSKGSVGVGCVHGICSRGVMV